MSQGKSRIATGPRCPDGRPHWWIISGSSGECKLCGQYRTDFVDDLHPKPIAISKVVPPLESNKPTSYRKTADYLHLKKRIIDMWIATRSIARTSRAFDPPIPQTTLRHLLKRWNPGPCGEVLANELVLSLQPGTVRLRIRGEPDIILQLSTGLSDGQLEIEGEATKQVESKYVLIIDAPPK